MDAWAGLVIAFLLGVITGWWLARRYVISVLTEVFADDEDEDEPATETHYLPLTGRGGDDELRQWWRHPE